MGIVSIKPPTERQPGPEPAGRVCAEEGCDTLLSTYNCGDTCARHGGWPKDRMTFVSTRDELADLMAA